MIVKNIVEPKNAERLANARKRIASAEQTIKQAGQHRLAFESNGGKKEKPKDREEKKPKGKERRTFEQLGLGRLGGFGRLGELRPLGVVERAKNANRRHPNGRRHSIGF